MCKKQKKIFLLCMFACLLITSFCFCRRFLDKDMVSKNIEDTGYKKQWYLHNKFTGTIKDDEPKDRGNDEFISISNEVQVVSELDLGVQDFWKQKKKDRKLVIAVLDTGIDIEHKDLEKHIWINEQEVPDNGIDDDNNGFIDDDKGWNFIENSNCINSDSYDNSHGTHCAGIIASEHDSIGTVGILGNTDVKIMSLPILKETDTNNTNKDTVKKMIQAIDYAEKMGAKICNLSCVIHLKSDKLYKKMKASSMLFVVAAGNYSSLVSLGKNIDSDPYYPACYNLDNIIVVGSVNSSAQLSDFSGYSAKSVDVMAPGEQIYSTLPNDSYGFLSGTSMSTAIATGVLGAYYYDSGDLNEAKNNFFVNTKKYSSLFTSCQYSSIVHYKKM